MTAPASCFVAYPSAPASHAESIEHAIQEISDGGVVDIIGWKSLAVGGRVLIETICEQIRSRNLFVADVTTLNPNVLFELGYAIAHRRRVWLVLDPNIEKSKIDFDRFQLLTTVGYCPYSNSHEITAGFYREAPYEKLDQVLYDELISSSAVGAKRDALLYLKSQVNTEATIRIARKVASGPLKSVIDDPTEIRVQPLSWYAQQVNSSFAVVCHLLSTDYQNWELFNAKHALIAGLAHGQSKPLLMLGHEPYVSPIDYRDLLRIHRTASAAEAIFNEWLLPLIEQYEKRRTYGLQYEAEARAKGELRNIAIGDPVAEFESDSILDYFVETASYNESLRSKHTILVGRKGAGKTATLYKLQQTLGADPRNHICVIKPVDYELEGLLDMLRQEIPRAEKGYLVESFWKFLVYTELTKSVYDELLTKPDYYERTDDESRLCEFVEQHRLVIVSEFSGRLEAAVSRLLDLKSGDSATGEQQRVRISERLHSEMIGKLRVLLGKVLTTKSKVVILVDNLDKAWTESADLELLSEFLYSLLGVSDRVAQEFSKDASRLSPINLYFTLFLRSDIHASMIRFARERDKLPVRRLAWQDPELLRRVVEERFVTAGAQVTYPAEIWDRYFTPTLNGVPTRECIMELILPRPRDLIYLVKASLEFAINRGHTRIEEKDLMSGLEQYSRFALDSLLVEAVPRLPAIESILLNLVGGPDVITDVRLRAGSTAASLSPDHIDSVIDTLGELTFLGYEVAPGRFEFLYELESAPKVLAMARKAADELNHGVRCFLVHPAYHRYLELRTTTAAPGQLAMDM